MAYLLVTVIFLSAQPSDSLKSYKDPWTKIIEKNGLEISFLFYEKGDNMRNGVVLKLVNNNDYSIQYSFELIFRNESEFHSEELSGQLEAGEVKTGSANYLFFLPFEEGVDIGEVGIKKARVGKAD